MCISLYKAIRIICSLAEQQASVTLKSALSAKGRGGNWGCGGDAN